MSRTSRSVAAVAAIASATALAAAAGNAAQASGVTRAVASPAGWRIVASFPRQSSIDDLAASGPGSAWAVESCRKPCASRDGVILRHWNGNAWQAEPQPANAKHAGNGGPVLAAAPGSPAVWALYGKYDHSTRASVAEWTGKSWAHPTVFHVGTSFQGLTAAGPSGLWAFGSREEFGSTSYVVRFDGKSWSQAPSPSGGMAPWTAVARSARDIWAQALPVAGSTLAFSHWNGTRWVNQAVPPAPNGAPGAYGGLGGDLAVSARNVWGFGYFEFKTGSAVYWLVHWNGKAWSNVRVPYALSPAYVAGPLGPDGHGGAWLAAIPAMTTREYLYHVTAAGHWTREPLPALTGARGTVIRGFAAIPGTASVYAYGWSGGGATQRGVILKYGA